MSKNENEKLQEQQENEQPAEAASVELEYNADMLLDMTPEERMAFLDEHGKGLQSISFVKALTEEQLNEKKDVLYELTVDLTDTKEEKADVMKDYSDKIKSLETQIGNVTKAIRKGTTDAYESCVKVLDLKNHKVYFFAQDTGQCAKIRDVRDDDLQQVFPFETIYNANSPEGEDVEFVVNRCGGMPEVGDEVQNPDGQYELEDGSLVTVLDSKITEVLPPETDEDEQTGEGDGDGKGDDSASDGGSDGDGAIDNDGDNGQAPASRSAEAAE